MSYKAFKILPEKQGLKPVEMELIGVPFEMLLRYFQKNKD